MVSRAVPLLVPMSGHMHAGSGFFVSHVGREWLVTAGHIPLNMPQPHCNWLEWPNNIEVAGSMHGQLSLPLKRVKNGAIDASFAYLGGGDKPMADFMALPVPGGTAEHMQSQLYSLDAQLPEAGFKARIIGYPTSLQPWPSEKASELEINIKEVTPEILFYTPSASPGTSGGPVLVAGDKLIGMTIGFDSSGKAVSAFAIGRILDANLAAGRFD
ncbi:hypothetical protein [Methylorubrum populi]|nr:hypothetical protein [Methylorubrum populi]